MKHRRPPRKMPKWMTMMSPRDRAEMKEIGERKAAINRVLAPLLKREAAIRARYEKRPQRTPAQPRLF